MKKFRVLFLSLLIGVFFVSCTDKSKNEWENLYGYSYDDIIGSYTYSNELDAFDGLTESHHCHVCSDTRITISLDFENTLKFELKCPKAEFNQTFTGLPTLNENDFLIRMSSNPSSTDPKYSVTAYVMSNKNHQIRLHGFARKRESEDSYVYYYFDVVKN